MKPVLLLLTLLGISVFAVPGLANEDRAAFTTDEFGNYFTASAPDALADHDVNDSLAANGSELTAEDLGNIEPAAGGESIFILPGDEPAGEVPAITQDGRLAAPETPLVPGMETQP